MTKIAFVADYVWLLVLLQFVPSLTLSSLLFNNDENNNRISIANMTCEYIVQPLNHFVPRGKSPTYKQRYCWYSGFVMNNSYNNSSCNNNNNNNPPPIFFYTGNESPLEEYIDHTGLMWELAPKFHAHVVFAEHRYEGKSLPTNLTHDCMSYASTIQALADFATLIPQIQQQFQQEQNDILKKKCPCNNDTVDSPVIAFGGSYGGMLSAWFRMKYPHLVTGAIAASAPIGSFPLTISKQTPKKDDIMAKLDVSARIITYGLSLSYPPDKSDTNDNITTNNNNCPTNLKASFPLLHYLLQPTSLSPKSQGKNNAYTADYSLLVQQALKLCAKPDSSTQVLNWAKEIWFDLAEGSFPYPSNYIPFALLHTKAKLPAWPVQAACWTESQMYRDFGVQINTTDQPNLYNITYGDSGLVLAVDWDNVSLVSKMTTANGTIYKLLTNLGDALGIWYNITKDVPCYNISGAQPWITRRNKLKNRFQKFQISSTSSPSSSSPATTERKLQQEDPNIAKIYNFDGKISSSDDDDDKIKICNEKIKQVGSWEPLCCNDEVNLITTIGQGMGNDIFWPPSFAKNVHSYDDLVRNVTAEPCYDPNGIYGYSKEPYDLWSTWLHDYYGDISPGHSNIVLSNGLLDPWSGGGVFAQDPWLSNHSNIPLIQNITNNNVIALLIPLGGHHTDLMYSDPRDPECVKQARQIEEESIKKWIHNYHYHH